MKRTDSENAKARLILLGASNLTRGISTVVETASHLFGSPLDVFAALGHGRSYGMRSSILLGARSLPAIIDCGIWNAIGESEKSKSQKVEKSKGKGQADERANTEPAISPFRRFDVSTFALITDIGNDIIYGATPQKIEQWVEQCIDRLQRIDATIAMTAIPIESIRSVTRWQYALVKALMYPTRDLTYGQARERADELHDRINALAQRRGITLVQQRGEWYGFDPIHVRYKHWPSAWAEILGACALQPNASACAKPSLRRWAKLRSMMPERWWLFGMKRSRPQPAGRLADGTTVSLY